MAPQPEEWQGSIERGVLRGCFHPFPRKFATSVGGRGTRVLSWQKGTSKGSGKGLSDLTPPAAHSPRLRKSRMLSGTEEILLQPFLQPQPPPFLPPLLAAEATCDSLYTSRASPLGLCWSLCPCLPGYIHPTLTTLPLRSLPRFFRESKTENQHC